MNTFYNDWISRKKYWFSQNNENDEYLSTTYGHLINDYSYNDIQKPILGILIYDQLTRHYYRNEYNNHILIYFNRKALEIADKHKTSLFIEYLDENDWIFYMLVYRHSNIRENILFVMNECWKLQNIPKSFIKATYNRANFPEKLDYYNYPTNFDRNILDNDPNTNEILLKPLYSIGNFKFNFKNNNIIIISLSGGVDSVVCLYNMINEYRNNVKIIAVHINYNNRIEVDDEVGFLRCLCSYYDIDLYVRKITEINRKDSMMNDLRDIYESYTKKIRFNSYKCIGGNNPIVILGHNKDDCLENILTNIAYNNKYENLIGFDYISKIDDITFIRPLINVYKNDIYDFAKIHNLPYLKNSTPDWCQRGKIRNEVKPVLENWDKRFIDGLFNLSDIMKDYNKTINNFKINDKNTLDKLNTSKLYWKYGLFNEFKIYISNKSLQSLIERLDLWKNKYHLYDINKKITIIINKNITLELIKKNDNYYEYKLIKYD